MELITRLKSLIEEERQKAGGGSLDMKVQSFNREEDLKTLLLGNHGPGDNENAPGPAGIYIQSV